MFSSKFSKPISITFLPKHADGIFKLESYKKNQNLNSLERRREHSLLFSRYAVDETSMLLPRKYIQKHALCGCVERFQAE